MKNRISRWAWLVMLLVLVLPVGAQDDVAADAEPVTWNGQTPFTILVLGMDRRPNAADTLEVRTDVNLLVRIDPTEPRVGVLHIPRDMHFGSLDLGELVRVNTLMLRGESLQEGYGPYFVMDTLQANFGMYIHAYVAFDFEAFITLIDAIGGVEVDVPYPISDPTYPDMNYGYDPFYINRGLHTLDGRTALKYARTRHQDNDYLRGERQMQIVEGVRQRLMDPVTLQTVLASAPDLIAEIDGHIYSNLTPEQIMLLGVTTLGLRDADVHYGGLNEDYSYVYASSQGPVRVPDRETIADLLTQVFGPEYWR